MSGADGIVNESMFTDDSVSKLTRKDGSPIKNAYLKQTRGFAPSEFNKHKFTNKITLKYDRTKFRPDFAIAPEQQSQSTFEPEAST